VARQQRALSAGASRYAKTAACNVAYIILANFERQLHKYRKYFVREKSRCIYIKTPQTKCHKVS